MKPFRVPTKMLPGALLVNEKTGIHFLEGNLTMYQNIKIFISLTQ